jgi:hypothetical protein
VHPYIDGVLNPKNRTFRTSCFNSRKLSPVFTGGPGSDEVPPIWIDRVGCKANITEVHVVPCNLYLVCVSEFINNMPFSVLCIQSFTKQSKLTWGLVLEEITTRDETSTICTHGARALPTGGLSMDGPPTTLSGTGVDRMGFLQANITRDNTCFINGAVVGDRNVFQVIMHFNCFLFNFKNK